MKTQFNETTRFLTMRSQIGHAARSRAHATVSASAVIYFEDVVVNGAFLADVRQRLACVLDLGGIPTPLFIRGLLAVFRGLWGAAGAHISGRHTICQEPVGPWTYHTQQVGQAPASNPPESQGGSWHKFTCQAEPTHQQFAKFTD